MSRGATAALAALAAVAGAGPATATATAAAPRMGQMVVARSGEATFATVRAAATSVRVGRRRCAIPAGTPLAALARSRPPSLRLRDFGSCSDRARDAAGLYVSRIGRDAARGRAGWVYKVGHRQGTAGAADPSGPFGRGPLRSAARITWFYCVLTASGSCQRTLGLRVRAEPGAAAVRVLAYDDEARPRPAAGATVRSGTASAQADASGFARLPVPAGRHRVRAEQAGLIRSFDEVVSIG
jgi:hypothetical protein